MPKCFKCKKKILIEFNCRCNKKFCITHKNPEEHTCTFDYKEHGKKIISDKNKKVTNDKIIKI